MRSRLLLSGRCNDERGLETFKFPRPTSYGAIVGVSRHPVALLEQLIAVRVDVSAQPVNLCGLCRRIRKAPELTAPAHVEYRVSGFVRGCHGLVYKSKLSAADRHWNGRGGEYDRDPAFRRHGLSNGTRTGQNGSDQKTMRFVRD